MLVLYGWVYSRGIGFDGDIRKEARRGGRGADAGVHYFSAKRESDGAHYNGYVKLVSVKVYELYLM